MAKKTIVLKELKDVQGKAFRLPDRDKDDNAITEIVKDEHGKPIMLIPRDSSGQPLPNREPEATYRVVTHPLGKEALPELLKLMYLRIPADKLTRQDTIYGTRMFGNIADSKDGLLELDDDVHDWIKAKLQDKEVVANDGSVTPGIGLKIFGIDLYVVEKAVDDFERLHEKKESEPKEVS